MNPRDKGGDPSGVADLTTYPHHKDQSTQDRSGSAPDLAYEALALRELVARVHDANDIGVYAVEYALHHWQVFPLRGKVPAIPGGRGVLDATDDVDQVVAWWSGRYRGANIGLRVPKSMFVLDVDPRHGGRQSLKPGQLLGSPRRARANHRGLPAAYRSAIRNGGPSGQCRAASSACCSAQISMTCGGVEAVRAFCRSASGQAHLLGHYLYRVAYPHRGQGE